MDKLTLQQLKEQQASQLKDQQAKFREQCQEVDRLVQLPAYSYAKSMAFGICAEYQCPPPATEAERQKWETYNTLLWAFNKFFGHVEELAKQSPEREGR